MPSIHSKSHKSYSLGDIIITCEPLVHVIYDEYKQKCCDYCFKNDFQLKMCSNCKQMFYCNQNCQKNDWICGHKYECNLYKEFGHEINEQSKQERLGIQSKPIERLLIRLYLMLSKDKTIASKGYQLANNKMLSFNDIECHFEDIGSDGKQMFDKMCSKLKRYGIGFDNKSLFESFYRVIRFGLNCESIAIDQKIEELMSKTGFAANIGFGLYIPLTVLSHSCAPNACHVMIGNKSQIRAIKPIDINQEITISYIFLATSPKLERQIELKKYLIDCKCNKCETNADQNIDYSKLKSLALDNLNETMECSSDYELHNRFVVNKEQIIPLLKQIYGDFHPFITTSLVLLFMTKSYINLRYNNGNKDLAQLRDYVRKCIEITHGRDHELYNKFEILVEYVNRMS